MSHPSIIQDIHSPSWWFTVVIVGLVIGVISGYIKDFATKFLSGYSSALRNKLIAQAMTDSGIVATLYLRAIYGLLLFVISLIMLDMLFSLSSIGMLINNLNHQLALLALMTMFFTYAFLAFLTAYRTHGRIKLASKAWLIYKNALYHDRI